MIPYEICLWFAGIYRAMNSLCVSAGAEGFLGLRIGGLFGILVASSVGVTIPYFTYSAYKLSTLYFILRAFAAGVVLTTGCGSQNLLPNCRLEACRYIMPKALFECEPSVIFGEYHLCARVIFRVQI